MIFPRSRLTRAAFSMIEVMIALTILAVAITGILGNQATLNNLRRDTSARASVTELGRAILDRIVACDLRALGVASAQANVVSQRWSLATGAVDPIDGVREPMRKADLVAYGLIETDLPIHSDLAVSIEYYRGVDVVDLATGDILMPGVLAEAELNQEGDFRRRFADDVWREARRLDLGIPPGLQVPEDDPVIIRIIIQWDQAADDPTNYRQRLEFFAAKRRPPGD